MSSPTLDSVLTVDVARTIPETPQEDYVDTGADATLTARAMVAVTLLGAGFWYLLWKTALHFWAGH